MTPAFEQTSVRIGRICVNQRSRMSATEGNITLRIARNEATLRHRNDITAEECAMRTSCEAGQQPVRGRPPSVASFTTAHAVHMRPALPPRPIVVENHGHSPAIGRDECSRNPSAHSGLVCVPCLSAARSAARDAEGGGCRAAIHRDHPRVQKRTYAVIDGAGVRKTVSM
jgi:hypothetical protein